MENEQEKNVPRENSLIDKLSVPFAIVIAGALIAVSLYYSNTKTSQYVKTEIPQETVSAKIRPISNEDHILGNPEADVIIVEYSDTECPFCKQFHITMRRVMDEYGKDGKVAWVYRHFPLAGLHSKAPKEAEALECANELGGPTKFWEYTNMLYEKTPSNNDLDLAELPKIAKDVGLDVTAFNTCLSSQKYKDRVQKDYDDAIRVGGAGTPHSIIISKDGTQTPIKGAYPYADLKKIIDAFLN